MEENWTWELVSEESFIEREVIPNFEIHFKRFMKLYYAFQQHWV